MRIAAVDVGTNSTRLLIAEVGKDCSIKELLKKGKVTRLGAGVRKSGRLSEESINRTLKTLKEFKDIIGEYKVERVVVATTEAARIAENVEDFLEEVRRLGFEINVLKDEEEAKLVFKANLLAFDGDKNIMTVDLGGGSTEIVYGNKEQVKFAESLKFGVVVLKEEFIRSDPPKEKEVKNLEEFLRKELLKFKDLVDEDFEAVAVGGTITSVVAMEEKMRVYDSEKVHGYKLNGDVILKWYKLLLSLKEEERKKIVGLEESRADVIVPGVVFFKVFCEVFNLKALTVSERGLLYGLILKEVGCGA